MLFCFTCLSIYSALLNFAFILLFCFWLTSTYIVSTHSFYPFLLCFISANRSGGGEEEGGEALFDFFTSLGLDIWHIGNGSQYIWI